MKKGNREKEKERDIYGGDERAKKLYANTFEVSTPEYVKERLLPLTFPFLFCRGKL